MVSPAALAASDVSRGAVDTIWLATCASLVFFMQAGFALFEGGMARSKKAVNVLMKNYLDVCVGGLIFWLVGFGLMFGDNPTGWIGTSLFAPNSGPDWDWTFLFFRMMFATTATMIASGATAGCATIEPSHAVLTGIIAGAITSDRPNSLHAVGSNLWNSNRKNWLSSRD